VVCLRETIGNARGHCVGKRAQREGRLARGQAVCEKSWHRETRPTRSVELAPGSAIRPVAN
jgi:hypothetical protein